MAIKQSGNVIFGTIAYQGNTCVDSPTTDFSGFAAPYVSITAGKFYNLVFSGGSVYANTIVGGTYSVNYWYPYGNCPGLEDAGTWTAVKTNPPTPSLSSLAPNSATQAAPRSR